MAEEPDNTEDRVEMIREGTATAIGYAAHADLTPRAERLEAGP